MEMIVSPTPFPQVISPTFMSFISLIDSLLESFSCFVVVWGFIFLVQILGFLVVLYFHR